MLPTVDPCIPGLWQAEDLFGYATNAVDVDDQKLIYDMCLESKL